MYLVQAIVKPFDSSGKPLGSKRLTGVYNPVPGTSKGKVIFDVKEFLEQHLKEQEPDVNVEFGTIKVLGELQFAINKQEQPAPVQ